MQIRVQYVYVYLTSSTWMLGIFFPDKCFMHVQKIYVCTKTIKAHFVFFQLFSDNLHLRVDGLLFFESLLPLLQLGQQTLVAVVKLLCSLLSLL